MLNFALYILACFLYVPLSLWNFLLVENKKGYFRSSALTIDRLANREFRTLWNKILIEENGYKFGNIEETISGVLGINILSKTLSKSGKFLVWILSEKHCINAILKK